MSDRLDGDAAEAEASVLASAVGTTVRLLALGALLVGSWRCVQRTHQRRQGGRSSPLHERLQNWEGEGGRPIPDPDGEGNVEGAGTLPTTPTTQPA